MVGEETIPIVLGRRKAKNLVVVLLIFLGGLLSVASPLGWATPASFFLLISLGYVVTYYWLYRERFLRGWFLFEGVVDGSFIFAGLLALIWAIV